MLKIILAASLLSTPALAQQMEHTPGMMQGAATAQELLQGNMGNDAGMQGMSRMQGMGDMQGMMEMMMGMMKMMQGMQSMGDQMSGGMHDGMNMNGTIAQPAGVGGSPLSEPGQSTFAAIAEVVNTLQADPDTDWSTVNIGALREHLRDMDVVTIDSRTVTESVDGGLKFTVTGGETVSPSIKRMAQAHADVMDGVNGWNYAVDLIDDGAIMTVTVPETDLAKLKGLGFYGIMASGMHHQPHHWMMATGGNPHQ